MWLPPTSAKAASVNEQASKDISSPAEEEAEVTLPPVSLDMETPPAASSDNSPVSATQNYQFDTRRVRKRKRFADECDDDSEVAFTDSSRRFEVETYYVINHY